MVRAAILLATFGLAVNLFLWAVPGLVAASFAARVAPPSNATSVTEILRGPQAAAGERLSLHNALARLIEAEAQALELVGGAIQNPFMPALAERAEHAGNSVLNAVQDYVRAAAAIVDLQLK